MKQFFRYWVICQLAKAEQSWSTVNVPNSTIVTSYEVTPPIPDYGSPCASLVIVDQDFGNSYGHPAFYDYTPPTQCADFSHVTVDAHFVTFGYQYDRLIHLLKDGVEIWRPSTPEPVSHNVTSHELKDLSKFVNLFKTPGTIEFDLDNLLAGGNLGTYLTKVVLTFYNIPGKSLVNDDSWFYEIDSPPTNFATILAGISNIDASPANGTISILPRNTTRAVLNVYASGNYNEEFWYTNDMNQYGPTRLVQVFVDGVLAGVADPFPVIYTGGIDPGLWQPLLGLRASDVPSYTVDITPFLPKLWKQETSTIEVAVGNGYGAAESVLSNWIIDVSLLMWQDSGVHGSGNTLLHKESNWGAPQNTSSNVFGAAYNYSVNNSVFLTFDRPGEPSISGTFTWVQNAAMNNINELGDTYQNVTQTGQGFSSAEWKPQNGSSNAGKYFERKHTYPLDLRLTNTVNGTATILEQISREYDVDIFNNGQKYWLSRSQDSEFRRSSGYDSINDVYEANYHRHAQSKGLNITQDWSN